MMMYPLMIDLQNKDVVVIGGGKIAANRVFSLLPYNPKITVISPDINKRLEDLVNEKKIHFEKRPFQPSDAEDAFIVIAATDDYETNQLVKKSCHPNQLKNIADDPKGSSFHFPAVHFQNGITFGVATSGISPTLAKNLRDKFAKFVEKYDEQYLAFLKDIRSLVKQKKFDSSRKKEFLQQSVQEKYLQSKEARQELLETIRKY